MKPNFTHSLLLGILLFCVPTVKAQDIHFSQFFETPLYRNPALAGIVNGDVRVQTVYRSQWNTVVNAYKTGSLNAEYKVPVVGDDFLTLGMQVFYDRSGSANLTSTQILPAINYHKSLSSTRNIYLSVGFMGGWVERRVDRSKITTNSTYDGLGDGESRLMPRNTYFDGSAGISLNVGLNDNPENNLVLGAALHHFNRPKNSFYNDQSVFINPKWVFSADAKFAVSEMSTLTIHSDYVKQGTYREIMGGIMYGLKLGAYSDEPDYIISGGTFMRVGDAIIPTLKLDYRPFSVALSYDVNTSKLTSTSLGRGGMELSVTYVGMLDRENSSVNAVLCPRF